MEKPENILDVKNTKITKQSHAYKGYASSYNVDVLNYFKPELQLNNIECAIRNKLIELWAESRGCKFVTTFVVKF